MDEGFEVQNLGIVRLNINQVAAYCLGLIQESDAV